MLARILAVLLLAASPAWAQVTKLSNCSQTVGATAAPVAFPTSGGVGAPAPTRYLEICNAHASQTLGVNVVGGTASIGAAGTITLNPGGCKWWDGPAVPAAASVIGSGASTTTDCSYH